MVKSYAPPLQKPTTVDRPLGLAAALMWGVALTNVLSACTQQISAAPLGGNKINAAQPASIVEPPSTLQRIEQLIDASRCERDEQCRVAAIGERPCGGAESYRAWSAMSTDALSLEMALRAYAEERRQLHEKVGVMSTCEIRPAPAARCERLTDGQKAGRCMLSGSNSDIR